MATRMGSATRIKVTKLSLQTENVEDWFDQYEMIAAIEAVTEPTPLAADATDEQRATYQQEVRRVTRFFLTSIEIPVYSLLKSLISPADVKELPYTDLKTRLLEHLKPKPTVLAERYQFYHLRQHNSESTADYLARLRAQGGKCEFNNFNEACRDQFICGLINANAREALLEEDTQMTLEVAFQKVVILERAKREANIFGTASSSDINAVRTSGKSKRPGAESCGKCGLDTHKTEKCRVKCFKCNAPGHLKANCPELITSRKPTKFTRRIDSGTRQHYSARDSYKRGRGRGGVSEAGRGHGRRQGQAYALETDGFDSESCVVRDDVDGELYGLDLENLHDYDINYCKIESKIDDLIATLSNVDDIDYLGMLNNSYNKLHDVKHLDPISYNESSSKHDSYNTSFSADKPMLNVSLNGKLFKMEFDSGASVSVCNVNELHAAGIKVNILPSDRVLRNANGIETRVIGKALVNVDLGVNGKLPATNLELFLTDSRFPSLLGRSWIEHFWGKSWFHNFLSSKQKIDTPLVTMDPDRRVRVVNSVTSEEDISDIAAVNVTRSVSELYESPIFKDGLGMIKNFEVALHLKEGSKPLSEPPRRIPLAVKPKLEKEYELLVKQGTLKKVENSPWGTPVVPVLKGDRVRVCGDYTRTLNKALEVKHHPLPTIEECFSAVAGGTKFSKIDIRQAYNNIRIREEDQHLTTLNTHIGQLAWTRVPYGMNISGDIFQESIDRILKGIPMTCCRVDDILVSGRTDAEHLKNLNEVVSRLENHGLRCRKDKTELFKDEVVYLGHTVNRNGIQAQKGKVDDLLKAPPPQNVKQLAAFLGAVGYYRRYLPDLSSIIAPLDKLRRRNVTWEWGKSQEVAFNVLKRMLCSKSVLVPFDQSLPVKLDTDASKYGLGVVISHVMHDRSERPIEFASRTLSDAEKRYSQIDKEALAIIWAVKRLHYYLYGRKFTLVTDHKPLVHIFSRNKQLPEMSANRISRWAIILMNYDYEIQYRKTRDHANCDMLSRFPVDNPHQQGDGHEVNEIFSLTMEQTNLDSYLIARETRKDPVLSKVAMYILDGWPEHIDDILARDVSVDEIRSYWGRRQQLTLEQDCITWGDRVVIPNVLRNEVLRMLHSTHIGRVCMKSLARSFVWWPNLDQDIDSITRICETCQKYGKNLPRVVNHPWVKTTRPWERIHIDFAGPFLGQMWLIVVDDYSKWPEVVRMRNCTTASATIRELRHIFSRNGMPVMLVSDQGPQFTSDEFSKFMTDNQIKHVTSPTYSPKSNGLAERFVQTFKYSMKKMYENSTDLDRNLANLLLTYRNTPHGTTKMAPAVLFQNRTLRSKMHQLRPSNQPKTIDTPEKNEPNLDRSFVENQKVWVKPNPGVPWKAAVVSKRYGNGPVYDVNFDNRVVKKHADVIKPRIKPVICLQKQTLPQSVIEEIRQKSTETIQNKEPEPVLRRSERLRLKTGAGAETTTTL